MSPIDRSSCVPLNRVTLSDMHYADSHAEDENLKQR